MNCGSIQTQSIPALQMTDTVGLARQCMEDAGYDDLPVLLEHFFKGLVHFSDLELYEAHIQLGELANHFSQIFVGEHDFFLTALSKIHERNLQCLPVINHSGEYTGSISMEQLAETISKYLSASEPGGIIILQMPYHQFSISELGRIVESNNAKIIHLTTWTDTSAGELMVSMKVNKIDIQDILASFERYQFTVSQYFGENLSEETLKSNFDNLMNYLRF